MKSDMLAPSHIHLRVACFIVRRERVNGRLRVSEWPSAIDGEVERGVGLPVAQGEASCLVTDRR